MNEKSPALQGEDEAQDDGPAPRDDLAELRRQNEELLTKLKYLQAEFENYRKRVDRDAATVVTLTAFGSTGWGRSISRWNTRRSASNAWTVSRFWVVVTSKVSRDAPRSSRVT